MPELPEVETVRIGLAEHVLKRPIAKVTVSHHRAIRRHVAGKLDFQQRLIGASFQAANRRGKYLWLSIAEQALMIHLGMSGQCLVVSPTAAKHRHERIRIEFADNQSVLSFVDQRTFGGAHLDELTIDKFNQLAPTSVHHVGLDPFDPDFDYQRAAAQLRLRRTEVKRALLDQTAVSGIGNIYADEALWLAKLHPRRTADSLSAKSAQNLIQAAAEVMQQALVQGGTSFDELYVNVNGESGYFSRSLNAYGQAGRPCPRCSRPIKRERFTNRYSHLCPNCQRAPQR
jgi:formamidopyrimidine-DNA glycosylase